MKIETERLIIRSIEHDDEKAFIKIASDNSLTEIGFDADCGTWISEWITEARILEQKDDPRKDYIAYAVELRSSHELIGTVGCSYYSETERIGIVYGIGAAHRNNGYACEAAKAYIRFFFEHYDEAELTAEIKDDNLPSRKTAEKAGFVLKEKRKYKDIYDTEEHLYRSYSVKRSDLISE